MTVGKYYVVKKPFWFVEEAACINILAVTDSYISYNYDNEVKVRSRDVEYFYDLVAIPASSLLMELI